MCVWCVSVHMCVQFNIILLKLFGYLSVPDYISADLNILKLTVFLYMTAIQDDQCGILNTYVN